MTQWEKKSPSSLLHLTAPLLSWSARKNLNHWPLTLAISRPSSLCVWQASSIHIDCLGTFGLNKWQLKVPTPRGQAPCPPCLHTLQGTARHRDQRTQHIFLLLKANGRVESVKFRCYAEFHLESMKHLSNAP